MSCPVCLSESSTMWLSVGLRDCTQCGHKWQYQVDDVVQYGRGYIERGYTARKVPALEMSWLRLGYLYLFETKGRLLDIGYGDGEFIRQANKAGYDAYGFDTHSDPVDGVRAVQHLTPDFDIVTMFDSLEHFQFLAHAFMPRARLYVVTVPHIADNTTEASISLSRHFKPGEHLHYFSSRSIQDLFRRYGYDCIASYPLEDIIRKNPDANPNTMTYVFKRHT